MTAAEKHALLLVLEWCRLYGAESKASPPQFEEEMREAADKLEAEFHQAEEDEADEPAA